eukprot:9982060-Alexandrium_andersonii.AAC.1
MRCQGHWTTLWRPRLFSTPLLMIVCSRHDAVPRPLDYALPPGATRYVARSMIRISRCRSEV